jgi:prepilin-type N-terminal cleavage/methylation domain-containing protein/prepilin-type processing-associated H-X9-DG protein
MCKRSCRWLNGCGAFTLVELLVVIAIIALLMSILMPALAGARKQGQAVMCLSRLKSWGLAFEMFAEDNDRFFPKSEGWGYYWLTAMLPYIGAEEGEAAESRELFLCPSARKQLNPPNCDCPGSTFSAWGPFAAATQWFDTGAEGSYGFNDWCANPVNEEVWGIPAEYCWRSPDVSGRSNVPVLADALYSDGFPMAHDEPPPFPDQGDSWEYNALKYFCMDRHNGGINIVFMDWSSRKVGLKELWKLKWHNQFDTAAPPPVWPLWMRKYKDH